MRATIAPEQETSTTRELLPLPPGAAWEGLRLSAELEVKGVRHPLRWACRQALNGDGSLSLRRNLRG